MLRYEDRPWVAHYEEGVPESLAYEKICMPDILERTAGRFPDRMALLFEGNRVSYLRLNEMVSRFAACLHAFGVQKGDRVAILLPNLIPCVVSYFAALKIGAIAVMNNPLYSDRELEYQLTDSGASILITLDLLANRMIDLRPKTPIDRIVYTGIGDYLPSVKKILFKVFGRLKKLSAGVKPADAVYRWKTLIESAPAISGAELEFDDTALCQYTGGTTGTPKGAMLSHGNLSRQVQQIASWLPSFRPGGETMLGAIPFFHAFGLSTTLNLSVYMGWGTILAPKPKTKALLSAIRRYHPSFLPLVPSMYIGILNHPDIERTDLKSVSGCFSGSAQLPREVIRDFEDKTGSVILEGYGLTEASPVTHINPFGGRRKAGSVGLPIPDTRCRIVDLGNGERDVAVGESGELLIQGPQVMKGYWRRPDETDAVLKGGWLRTGDIAVMDEEGYFYIVDRKKDLVISGGLNIYPREVEEVFYLHPKVQEACCIGVPHPRWGEAVKIYVVLKEGETAGQEELLEFCRPLLAKYKRPQEIEFCKSLPKNSLGKIVRRDLKSSKLKS